MHSTPVLELRSAGERRLAGTVLRYGDEAVIGGVMRECFVPGSVGLAASGVGLNVMHERGRLIARWPSGGLEIEDGPERLEMRATLPGTREANDTLSLVKSGVLGGLSGEFRVQKDDEVDGVRVIQRATLHGIGVVDAPAYGASSVEVRQEGRGLRGRFLYGQNQVTSDRGKVRKRRIEPGAFRVGLEDMSREVSLIVGDDYSKIVASRMYGNLDIVDGPEELEWMAADLAQTSYVNDLRAILATKQPMYTRVRYRLPPDDVVKGGGVRREPDPENPEVEVEVVDNAILTALSIHSRPARGVEGNEVEARRRRFWL